MNYRKTNNIVGWITGAIAYIVYLKTMEPTVSYWDCGEFLSCAYKLEVGHSPGAPFFMLLQRFWGLFSGSGAATGQPNMNAAIFINSLSALTSALTILFLFWTITHFAKKLVAPGKDIQPEGNQIWVIMGAGLVGALAYTFSDTFWFSAVEAEVYGTSSFFTAITMWAVLKWENQADEKHADRWLVLIAYLIGLSVCVHLLNLLTIPVVTMVYYFRRYNATILGTFIAFVIGCVILAFVQFGVIQYIPIFASKFDLFFTNNLGMSFDTGAITFMVLLFALLAFLVVFAKRKNWYLLHTGVLCILFIVIGYSCYLVAVIRSRADVPIDMTNPDNPISLLSYVSREQFGEQPLLFGQNFDEMPMRYDVTGDMYNQTKTKEGKDYYEVVGKKRKAVYADENIHFFPRIYENADESHKQFYRSFLNLANGETPSTADNYKYFVGYQMGWMWWRYFMWNYVGRENDFEGQGEPKNGNWVSGIKFIDKSIAHVGDMDAMSDGYKNNRARNQLYFLPFILGILGLIYQFNRNRKDGLVVLILFFFTGAAIGIYLNMPPVQPRERDYAFAGCTYAFAMWIGLGVLMVDQWMKRIVKNKSATLLATVLSLVAVPGLMAKEEWDDHDRSKKYLAHDTAYNTLASCAPNAILFTFGDNDTYPVWYIQEIEHFRPDVRVINMSLLGIDWYIDQLNYKINDADAVPMIWKKDDYVGERHNYIYVRPEDDPNTNPSQYYELKDICAYFINPNKISPASQDNFIPTKKMHINGIDKNLLVSYGMVEATDTAYITTGIHFTFPKNAADKSELATLNMIAAIADQGWKRPVYFDGALPGDNFQGMGDYLKLEGTVYRLVPYKYANDSMKGDRGEMGFMDINKSYDLFMNKYKWGNANRTDVYFDEKNRLMFQPYRLNSARLANELNLRGKKKEAFNVLNKVTDNISERSYAYDILTYYDIAAYYNVLKGVPQNDPNWKIARDLTDKYIRNLEDDVNWVNTLRDDDKQAAADEVRRDLSIMNAIKGTVEASGDMAMGKKIGDKLEALSRTVSSFMPRQ